MGTWQWTFCCSLSSLAAATISSSPAASRIATIVTPRHGRCFFINVIGIYLCYAPFSTFIHCTNEFTCNHALSEHKWWVNIDYMVGKFWIKRLQVETLVPKFRKLLKTARGIRTPQPQHFVFVTASLANALVQHDQDLPESLMQASFGEAMA